MPRYPRALDPFDAPAGDAALVPPIYFVGSEAGVFAVLAQQDATWNEDRIQGRKIDLNLAAPRDTAIGATKRAGILSHPQRSASPSTDSMHPRVPNYRNLFCRRH